MAVVLTRSSYGWLCSLVVCALAISAVASQNPLVASLRLPAAVDSATSSRALPPGTQTAFPTALTYPDGLTTTGEYVYDSTGNLIRKVDRLDRATISVDNLRGQVRKQIDPLGRVIRYTYDSLRRLVSIATPNGVVSRIQHDAIGRMIAHEDSMGRRTVYMYDLHDRMTKVTFPDGTVA